MINYVWGFLIIISVICAIVTGNGEGVSSGLMNGAEKATKLLITLFGVIVFWSGIMKVAEKSGLTGKLVKLLSPILRKIFPDVDESSNAFQAMALNISANLIGIGNAATPFGLKAMAELQKNNLRKSFCTHRDNLTVILHSEELKGIVNFN